VNSEARRGVVLLAVLWTVALIATLAMAAATTFRGFTSIMAIDRDRLQAEGLLTAGLEVAAGLASSAGETPLIDVQSTVRLSSGAVRLRLEDEGGFIDVGKAPLGLLASLLRSLGEPDADTVAGAIVAWRKSDVAAGAATAPAAGSTAANASSGGASAPSTNGTQAAVPDSLFTDVAQLRQIPGMRPQLVAAVAPLATVFGNATINPLTAPPAVLAALPGIDPARLAAFLDARRFATDPKQVVASLGAAPIYLEVKPPQAVRVHLAAALSDGYAAAAEAVIVCLPKDRQPYRVLAWNPMPSLQP
jgi:general secretion pathway protein K